MTLLTSSAFAARPPAAGPLRVHPDNGRYFQTPDGRARLMAGSHTWSSIQEIRLAGDPDFDFEAYLDMAAGYGHTFLRLWMYEQPVLCGWSDEPVRFDPLPWERPGPGVAGDGGPKFDLTRFNEAYFSRLRTRAARAGERGFYVSIMLFQGWSLKKMGGPGGDPYTTHPFNPANNVQGVGGVPSTEDSDTAATIHSLGNPAVVALQEAYVRRVVETLNDLPNVTWEICNEGGALAWQRHFIRFIREVEGRLPLQHPVGFSHRISPRMWNEDLFTSEADWVAPAKEPLEWMYTDSEFVQHYEQDPPEADGRKVVILDTDHLQGIGGDATWVWKSVCRGLNPIFMDPWGPLPGKAGGVPVPWLYDAQGRFKNERYHPEWEPLRAAMGDAVRLTNRMDLARATPRSELASTRYCLAVPGESYLVCLPQGGRVTLDLRSAPGDFTAEWLNPRDRGGRFEPVPFAGSDYRSFAAPFEGPAVLFITRNALR
jgi:hypothetical protein